MATSTSVLSSRSAERSSASRPTRASTSNRRGAATAPRVYFVTARGGNFDIYRYRFGDKSETPFISGARDQIQPAESPDGTRLAYVSPVQGRLGTGGLWVKPVAGGDATLVHYEETEYRARPAWTPDGQAILFSSDEPGSNDIAIIPIGGGNPVYLSADPMNEFAPTVSPDGARFAFVSNRTGPTTLYVAPTRRRPHLVVVSSGHEVPKAGGANRTRARPRNRA